jgi:hypothetical protein
MAEVLVRFTDRITAEDGTSYLAQACGGIADDGLWEGWIEFTSLSGASVRTPRETEQPNRVTLVYWAEGLTVAYLQGALRRAIVARMITVPPEETSSSISSRPAPRRAATVMPHAILDPFATYAEGEELMRNQLRALSHDHLVGIIRAYRLPVDVHGSISDARIVDGIVAAVAHRVG